MASGICRIANGRWCFTHKRIAGKYCDLEFSHANKTYVLIPSNWGEPSMLLPDQLCSTSLVIESQNGWGGKGPLEVMSNLPAQAAAAWASCPELHPVAAPGN